MSSQTTQQNPSSSPGNLSLADILKGLNPGTTYIAPALPYPPHGSPYIEVGKGARSTVFSSPDTPIVLKKKHPGGLLPYAENVALYEHYLGVLIHRSFEGYHPASSRIRVKVPAPRGYFSGDNTIWDTALNRLPNPHRAKTAGFIMEMIQSLPDAVRAALVLCFHPRSAHLAPDTCCIQDVLRRPENRHCLVQPCLGEAARPFSVDDFSLRDLQLGVSDMQRVGMDVKELASAVGEAFAVLHWKLGITGWGVEFVIGTSLDRESDTKDRHAVNLYLIDFGDCRLVHRLSHPEGVKGILADSMLSGCTRRFIPSPVRSPQLYWIFKSAYFAQVNKIGRLSGDRRPEEVMGYYEEQILKASR
ncbi:hypothetical protein ACJ41O_014859 [Fusarium nematophilum]